MCTNIKIQTITGDWITGRTNEFSGIFNSELLFIPKNYKTNKFFNRPDLGQEETKYAMLGNNIPTAPQLGLEYEKNFIADGINEFGLSVSTQYFPIVFGLKTIVEAELQSNDVSLYLLNNLILGNCRTTEEARLWIKENAYRVVGLKQDLPIQGVHFAVLDPSGDSIVIEPEENTLKIKENPLGTMTNSPNMEWHQENLANYINLSPIDKVSNSKFIDNQRAPYIKRSMGNGAKNIPGDWSASSRFIRATFLALNASKPKDVIDGVNTCFRLLHTSDIVAGTVITPVSEEAMNNPALNKVDFPGAFITDVTDNIIVKDLTNKILYYKDIYNISPRFVDIKDYLGETTLKKVPFKTDKALKFQKVILV